MLAQNEKSLPAIQLLMLPTFIVRIRAWFRQSRGAKGLRQVQCALHSILPLCNLGGTLVGADRGRPCRPLGVQAP